VQQRIDLRVAIAVFQQVCTEDPAVLSQASEDKSQVVREGDGASERGIREVNVDEGTAIVAEKARDGPNVIPAQETASQVEGRAGGNKGGLRLGELQGRVGRRTVPYIGRGHFYVVIILIIIIISVVTGHRGAGFFRWISSSYRRATSWSTRDTVNIIVSIIIIIICRFIVDESVLFRSLR
jgi:hypothetical protein